MDNPIAGTVEIELGGKPYQLCFTWSAVAEIETALKMPAIEAQRYFPQIDFLRAFVFAGTKGAVTEDVLAASSPALSILSSDIRKALYFAYHGTFQIADDDADDDEKQAGDDSEPGE